MRKFRQYLEEALIREVYHISPQQVNSLRDEPMWFALEKSHADAWFANTVESHGKAFLYKATLSSKNISHIKDREIVDIFKSAGEKPSNWETAIVENPNAQTVLRLKGTKALIAAGHIGLIYSDYDPRDFQKDLDALVIFSAKRNVKTLRKI